MGSCLSTTQRPKVGHDVLRTSCSAPAWTLLYSGDADTWDSVAAQYGMDKPYEYSRGFYSNIRYRDAKRLQHMVSVKNRKVIIQRFQRPTVYISTDDKGIWPFFLRYRDERKLKYDVAAERRELALLLVNEMTNRLRGPEISIQPIFLLVYLGDETNGSDYDENDSVKSQSFRCLSGKKDRVPNWSRSCETVSEPSSFRNNGRRFQGERLSRTALNGSHGGQTPEDVTGSPGCLGFFHAPHEDMYVDSCQISPDLSHTAVLLRGQSRSEGTFIFTLHCYSNFSLQRDNRKIGDQVTQGLELGAERAPLRSVHTVKLSEMVRPFFAFDPRYGATRMAVANYKCRDKDSDRQLVVLNLHCGGETEETRVTQSKAVLLPAHNFHYSDRLMEQMNLLYSKDGELIVLQNAFRSRETCDIYIFSSDDLIPINNLTTSVPKYLEVCYEPLFSRCGSLMRLADHVYFINDLGGRAETVDRMTVHIYRLPRSLCLMNLCRQVILQSVSSEQFIDTLPLPRKLKDYLRFRPMYC